jgi:cyclophilin family peptidyl-prolyl cis-trans isomerase
LTRFLFIARIHNMNLFSVKHISMAIGILAIIIIGSMFVSLPKIELQSSPEGSQLARGDSENTAMEQSSLENDLYFVTLGTNYGVIKFTAYDADAPKTVQNFINLANDGYYNGLTFHRVISGFMIQGGDPNCTPERSQGACGTGGPGYQFEDELNPITASYQEGYKRGVVAMANAGPNTNGSQFFIMHADYPLPNNYTIFGKVIEGMEVVDAIASAKTDAGDRPLSPVIIKIVTVAERKAKEKSDLIRVRRPRVNEIITSPVAIEGEARGFWFFEASFPIKVLDDNGKELGVGVAQAQSEWMTEDFVPFRAEVGFKAPPGNNGELVFEKDNPSGLPEHADEIRIPVRFK